MYLYGEYMLEVKILMVCQVGFDSKKNCVVSLNGTSIGDGNVVIKEILFG